jgi:serine/threonine-protein kinase RsbW
MRENKNHAPETLERSLDSTLESVDSAEELALSVAQRAGFDDDDLMKIGMAVRESMVNAVVHGNRYYAGVPNPLAPENLMRTSGRGIFLIRSFMDEFEMRHREPQGTEVTLVKYVVSK